VFRRSLGHITMESPILFRSRDLPRLPSEARSKPGPRSNPAGPSRFEVIFRHFEEPLFEVVDIVEDTGGEMCIVDLVRHSRPPWFQGGVRRPVCD
jgi:hypothetical protein